MDELNDFIHIYENAIEPNVCEFLINLFEQVPDKYEEIDNDGKQKFTQFNLTENCKLNDEVNNVHNYLIHKTFEYKNKYYEFTDARVFPKTFDHAFEQFRIKRYKNDGVDKFDTHVDVVNHSTARRFLSFFWYLNNVEAGGETRFKDVSVTPKQGTLVMFPPFWMFPHKAEPPISNPKYLLHTYLHYK
jgi:hypothetical protein